MPNKKVESYFFATIFIGTLALVAYLFLPYLGALAVALVLAALVHPLHKGVQKICPFDSAAALITVFIATIALLAPAVLMVYLIAGEVRSMSVALTSTHDTGVASMLVQLEDAVNRILPVSLDIDLRSVLADALGVVSRNLGGAFASTANIFLKLFVALIALYYFLKDGATYKAFLVRYSPLPDDEDRAVLKKLEMVTHSLIRGRLVIALIQGVLTGIGLTLFGLPNPVLWGSVATITAILPTIGTAFVTVPAFLWLVLIGSYIPAFLFGLYGVVIIGLVDNILGPRIIGHGAGVQIHPLLILLSVLGGLGVFGPAGFLIGPLVLALLIALAHIYAQKTGIDGDAA